MVSLVLGLVHGLKGPAGDFRFSVNFENDVALPGAKAVATGETGWQEALLVWADQAVGARVTFDKGNPPTLGRQRHVGVRTCEELNVGKVAQLL